MAWQELNVKLISDPVSPGLLMHNGQLADPMNYYAKLLKQISGKRNKTEADFIEMAHIEFLGSLYMNDGGPVIPSMCIEATLLGGARKTKQGKSVESGVVVNADFPLEYDGPRKADELWQLEQFRLTVGVRVQRNRVMRTRPLFREWAASGAISYEDTVLNKSTLKDILVTGGSLVGICDWRPKFGRFVVEFPG